MLYHINLLYLLYDKRPKTMYLLFSYLKFWTDNVTIHLEKKYSILAKQKRDVGYIK